MHINEYNNSDRAESITKELKLSVLKERRERANIMS